MHHRVSDFEYTFITCTYYIAFIGITTYPNYHTNYHCSPVICHMQYWTSIEISSH